jgi:hypothetical protein
MAHFAKIENGIVGQVIVVNNEVLGDLEFPESEPVGQAFIASLGLGGEWKQTSYNGNFRGAYAGAGMTYDSELDEFVAPVVETETPAK